MRVLVAADAMAGLGPRDASEVIATAFADAGAQVAVVPLADGGQGFADAVAELDPEGLLVRPGSLSEMLELLSEVDASSPTSNLRVDLTGLVAPAWSELTAVGNSDIAELAAAISQRKLVAVVASADQSSTLTGLSGRVAERGREDGLDLGETLAADDAVSKWLGSVGVDGTAAGTGAANGVGSIILALGGRVLSGIEALIEGFGMEATVAKADLLVTGTPNLDFHVVGGDVVKEVARLGTDALRPVIAIVGRNFVSSRELRLAGIESAHAVLDGAGDDQPVPAQLAEVAGRVAKSWIW